MFKLSDLVQKGRTVALGLDMADAGKPQQFLSELPLQPSRSVALENTI